MGIKLRSRPKLIESYPADMEEGNKGEINDEEREKKYGVS